MPEYIGRGENDVVCESAYARRDVVNESGAACSGQQGLRPPDPAKSDLVRTAVGSGVIECPSLSARAQPHLTAYSCEAV